jgi:hypothetical protein
MERASTPPAGTGGVIYAIISGQPFQSTETDVAAFVSASD